MANKIEGMFFGCSALTELDILSLDTTNVESMDFVFRGCKSLRHLDMHNFAFDNARSIFYMFEGCSSLTKLDLSSFRTDKIWVSDKYWAKVSIAKMFSGCYRLREIVGELDLSMAKLSDDMFSGCSSLETLYLKYSSSKYDGMYNSNDIDLGDTKVKDECLIYIINELPDLASYNGTPPLNGWAEFILPKTNTLTREQVQKAVDKGWYVENVIFNWGETK
jgi:surface protein